jgi:hypothetical protein
LLLECLIDLLGRRSPAYRRFQTIYEIRILFRIPAMVFDVLLAKNFLMKQSHFVFFKPPIMLSKLQENLHPFREKLSKTQHF